MRPSWSLSNSTRRARTGNRTRIICLEGRCAGRYTTRTKAKRCVSDYAILAYKSFPSDSNRQPADYETAALPLRQRSLLGTAGIEPASSAYKTGALPLDEVPKSGNSRDRTCGLLVNGRTLCQLSYTPKVEVNGIAPLTFRVSDGCSAY